MAARLDHLILPVNDVPASVAFYEGVLGFGCEGERPPFTVVRVADDLTLQLAPWGTEGNVHLAFALPRDEFDAAFARIRAAGVAFGASFHDAANACGPRDEDGARGPGKTIYLLDPSRHLIELRHYD